MTTAPHPHTTDTDLFGHTELRAASTPADLDVVRALLDEVGLHYASTTLAGSTYWLAYEGGRPVGTVGLEHGDGASLLRSAAVLPGARGEGLGRALARSALTLATLRGDRAVYLFSSDAGAYWQRLGFEEVAVTDLAAALPDVPQVVSGVTKGWIHEERAWKLTLTEVDA
ncbi:GNAT family N-acetyltransferase [Deinococcus pimensis]|uniref:GNAT family N-acetyltransferase n=1 Tax=Deinococcus pimensis TaxID=309888 RepID=UPI0004BCB124|nr:GNAT family N-acetyltransferase [Deinococcus pimensis]